MSISVQSTAIALNGSEPLRVQGDSVDIFWVRGEGPSAQRTLWCSLRGGDVLPAFDVSILQGGQLMAVPFRDGCLRRLDEDAALPVEALRNGLASTLSALSASSGAQQTVRDVLQNLTADDAAGQSSQALLSGASQSANESLRRLHEQQLDEQQRRSQRLLKVSEQGRRRFDDSRRKLYATTENTHQAGGDADDAADNLRWVLAVAGPLLSMHFRLPTHLDTDTTDSGLIDQICSASGVRYREVALKGDWWKHDNGVLLVRESEDGPWAVIQPRFLGGNVLIRQTGLSGEDLDESTAASLNNFAFMFYPAFASRPLSMLDVLRVGFQGQSRNLAAIAGVSVLSGLLGLVTPQVMAWLVDEVLPSADGHNLALLAVLLIVVGAAGVALNVFSTSLIIRMEARVGNVVQSAVWDRVLRLPMTFLRQYSTGELAQRITGINQIRQQLSIPALQALLGGVFSIFNFFVLFAYSVKMAIFAAMVTLVAAVASTVLGVMKLRVDTQLVAVTSTMSNFEFQSLSGIARVRVSAAELRFFSRWADLFAVFRKATYEGERLLNIEQILFTIFPMISTVMFMWLMGQELLVASPEVRTAVTAGDYIAFTAAFAIFFGGMTHVVETLLSMMRLVPTYRIVRPLLETSPESDDSTTAPAALKGGVSLGEVSFRYGDGPLILDNVTLDIAPGEYVALVGPSGSGKSTLFRLLLGFEKPMMGSVSYDGQDLATVNAAMVRQQLGVVLQNGKLMAGDIYSNIVGASRLPLDRAMEAARMVGLDADLEKMPMGLHTVVSDGSSTLSGGQRQRILIARAIVNRPRILLFDEATSALDNTTQAVVTESLDRLSATRIVIAHRLSTIVNADRIVVLDRGRIVQQGTFAELSTTPGVFQNLMNQQM